MDTRIQELTEKLYNEGVEKGNAEAQNIVSEAEAKRAELIRQAEADAKRIVADAGKKADELDKNTRSELKLYAAQTLEALKSAVANQIAGNIVSSNVKAAMADPDFVRNLIVELVRKWTPGEQIVLQTSDADGLAKYFEANAKELLSKQVAIEEVNGRQTGFTITPKDGSYKVEFGEEQFVDFFKSFLRPRLVEMLF